MRSAFIASKLVLVAEDEEAAAVELSPPGLSQTTQELRLAIGLEKVTLDVLSVAEPLLHDLAGSPSTGLWSLLLRLRQAPGQP